MGKKRIGAVALLMAAIVAVSALITLFTGRIPSGGRPPAGGGADGAAFRVVASFYPVYIAALNVTQDVEGVSVENLVPPRTGCLHDYQMAPDDMIALKGADLLLVNGAGAESFLDAALRQFPSLTMVDTSAGVSLLESGEPHDHGEESEEEHAAHTFYNEHIWVSPARYARQVENLRDGLMAADPGRAESYRANAARYLDQIGAVEKSLKAETGRLGYTACVTFHDSMAYLADELSLTPVAALALGEEAGLSASDAAQAQQAAAEAGRVLLLYDSQYPVEYEYIGAGARESRTLVIDTAVSGPEEAGAWLAAMNRNLEALRALEA